MRRHGCNSNGAVNGGTVEIWVGFKNGTADDVVGATIIGPDGRPSPRGRSTWPHQLRRVVQRLDTYFNFRNLTAGTYQVRMTRNGDFASETSFEVS